ncbi:MAG: hypothetical protein RJS97_02805 [Parvibaculaceae bacterium]
MSVFYYYLHWVPTAVCPIAERVVAEELTPLSGEALTGFLDRQDCKLPNKSHIPEQLSYAVRLDGLFIFRFKYSEDMKPPRDDELWVRDATATVIASAIQKSRGHVHLFHKDGGTTDHSQKLVVDREAHLIIKPVKISHKSIMDVCKEHPDPEIRKFSGDGAAEASARVGLLVGNDVLPKLRGQESHGRKRFACLVLRQKFASVFEKTVDVIGQIRSLPEYKEAPRKFKRAVIAITIGLSFYAAQSLIAFAYNAGIDWIISHSSASTSDLVQDVLFWMKSDAAPDFSASVELTKERFRLASIFAGIASLLLGCAYLFLNSRRRRSLVLRHLEDCSGVLTRAITLDVAIQQFYRALQSEGKYKDELAVANNNPSFRDAVESLRIRSQVERDAIARERFRTTALIALVAGLAGYIQMI